MEIRERASHEVRSEEFASSASSESTSTNRSSPLAPPLTTIGSRHHRPPLSNPSSGTASQRRRSAAPTVDLMLDDFELNDDCLEDDDLGDYRPPTTRGRRFVITDDEDDEAVAGNGDEVVELKLEEDEDDGYWESDGPSNAPSKKVDLIGRALRKCGKIVEELRRELYGLSLALPLDSNGYAEVDASSAMRSKCGVINPRFDVGIKEIESWATVLVCCRAFHSSSLDEFFPCLMSRIQLESNVG